MTNEEGDRTFSREPQASAADPLGRSARLRLAAKRFPGRWSLVIGHWSLVIGIWALVISPAAARAEADDAPVFALRTADGRTARGPLLALGPGWSVQLGGKAPVKAAGDEVLSLRRAEGALPPPPDDQHLVLTNGDRVPFKGLRLAGERLHFRNALLADGKDAEASAALASVALIWLTAPASADSAETYRRELLSQTRKRDVVVLRNGDVLEGLLNKLEGDRLEIEVDRKPVTVKLPQAAVVAPSTELAEKPKPKGVQARLVLGGDDAAAGARLTLVEASSDGRTLTGKTAWGAAVKAPLARVAALDLTHGRALYLSELQPARYEFTPFLGETGPRWPLGRDGTPDGRDLRLGGSVYDRGLGMHTQSRATYDLPAGCRRFEALVGLDDRRGRRGAVKVQVLVDGKAADLGLDGELTAATGPRAVSVPLTGARTLTLVVDFGARGDVQGVVDWADARLVK
jgi:hypothetical protein